MQQIFRIEKIKSIIGLGNPSKEFQETRHNIGHLFIDFLAERFGNGKFIRKDLFQYKKINFLKKEIVIIKTQVFMNQSGLALKAIKKAFKLKNQEMLIAHDDSDLIFGNFKISFSKGAAGHKGIESIFLSLKNKNFWRLRIGIRPEKTLKSPKWIKAEEFVLKKFSRGEKEEIEQIFEKIIRIFSKEAKLSEGNSNLKK